ncbi:acyl-CoA dehydrogenase family protein [Solirubrobacter ginsenosidimutans]|uniref:Acyl-CoA dehydrogenase family protein n=1 Tax=Solirubrobacter ginsenosidimutans TaxID=490573 RepID=A0A9X3RZI7_9ACTN|nr:acyl-CoA dehydrogenase family protein [Solirubrobacter ginsenosidimutans]MDA0160920.1 acyl-CoA dehydrogenase family protein [Solirubrobacter ginsenosidimutans]
MIELQATTGPGAWLVRLAGELGERDASFPHTGVAALKRAGFFTAPIPAELGGLGVTSVHDVVVASSRLARGDAALASEVNVHLAAVLALVRRWSAGRSSRLAAALREVVSDGVVLGHGFIEDAGLEHRLLAELLDASVSLGVAEGSDSPRAIELSAAQATLSRAAALVDADGADTLALFAHAQAANAFIDAVAGRALVLN